MAFSEERAKNRLSYCYFDGKLDIGAFAIFKALVEIKGSLQCDLFLLKRPAFLHLLLY